MLGDKTTRMAPQLGLLCNQRPTSPLGTLCLTRTYSIFFFFYDSFLSNQTCCLFCVCCMCDLGKMTWTNRQFPPYAKSASGWESILIMTFSTSEFSPSLLYAHLFHGTQTLESVKRPVTANYTTEILSKTGHGSSVCECAWREVITLALQYVHYVKNNVSAKNQTWQPCYKWRSRCDNVRYLHIPLWAKYKLETKIPGQQQVASRTPW